MSRALDMDSEFDVLVVGGGPAGVVTAIGLHRLGHAVGLVSSPRRFAALEGISARACAGLDYCGCRRALASVGSAVPRIAYWNGRRSDHNQECIVHRKCFDEALRRDAVEAGLTISAGRVLSMSTVADGWVVRVRAGSSVRQVTAGYLVDARGRSAGGSRKCWFVGPATMSLGQIWQTPSSLAPGSVVATSDRGWVWHARPQRGTAVVQAFVSIEHAPLPPRSKLARFYRDLVDRASPMELALGGGRPLGCVYPRDAGTALHHRVIESKRARVGDAALRIDPLSGHGLYQAVSGGLALVPVVNTRLRRPQDAVLADGFYRDKLHFDFWHMAGVGRDFYRLEQRWPKARFWQERQSWPGVANDAAIAADVRPRIERRPVSADGFVVERDVVVTHDHSRGVWKVAGVSLVDMLDMIRERGGLSVSEAASEAPARLAAGERAVSVAASWLVARGLLQRENGKLVVIDAPRGAR